MLNILARHDEAGRFIRAILDGLRLLALNPAIEESNKRQRLVPKELVIREIVVDEVINLVFGRPPWAAQRSLVDITVHLHKEIGRRIHGIAIGLKLNGFGAGGRREDEVRDAAIGLGDVLIGL